MQNFKQNVKGTKMDLNLILKLLPIFFGQNQQGFTLDSLKPIISAFTQTPEDADVIFMAITKLINGEIDVNRLIPQLLPLVLTFFQQNKNAPETESVYSNCLKLEPIENLCDEQNFIFLKDYFNN